MFQLQMGQYVFVFLSYTLSGRTGSALVWHTHGRVFEPRLTRQVLRFVRRVYTVQYAELKGTADEGGGCGQSIGCTVFDAIVRS